MSVKLFKFLKKKNFQLFGIFLLLLVQLNIFGIKSDSSQKKGSARVHPEGLKPPVTGLPDQKVMDLPKSSGMSGIETGAIETQKGLEADLGLGQQLPVSTPRPTRLIEVKPAPPNKFDIESEKKTSEIIEANKAILEKRAEIQVKQEEVTSITNQLKSSPLQDKYKKVEEIRKKYGILSPEYKAAAKEYNKVYDVPKKGVVLSTEAVLVQNKVRAINDLARLQQAQADLSAQKTTLIRKRDEIEGDRYFHGMTDVEKKMLDDSQRLNAKIESKKKEIESLNSMFKSDAGLNKAYQDFKKLKDEKDSNLARLENFFTGGKKDKELAAAKAAYNDAFSRVSTAKNEQAAAINKKINDLATQKEALNQNLQRLYEKRLDDQMELVDVDMN